MKKKMLVFQLLFTVILSITVYIGILQNPAFNINDFFASLSTEFIGWALAITIFQSYFDEKMAVRENRNTKEDLRLSLADEILKLKSLLDDDIITQDEFESCKNSLICKFLPSAK